MSRDGPLHTFVVEHYSRLWGIVAIACFVLLAQMLAIGLTFLPPELTQFDPLITLVSDDPQSWEPLSSIPMDMALLAAIGGALVLAIFDAKGWLDWIGDLLDRHADSILLVELVLFAAVSLAIFVWSDRSFGTTLLFYVGALVVSGIAIVAISYFLFVRNWLLVNLKGVLVAGGTGAVFGVHLSIEVVVAILALLTVFDIIAVYYSDLMDDVVRQIEDIPVAVFVAPSAWVAWDEDFYLKGLDDHWMLLGWGDAAFPAALTAAATVATGIVSGLLVVTGGLVGLLAPIPLMAISEIEIHPGLPGIVLGCFAGYGVQFL